MIENISDRQAKKKEDRGLNRDIDSRIGVAQEDNMMMCYKMDKEDIAYKDCEQDLSMVNAKEDVAHPSLMMN